MGVPLRAPARRTRLPKIATVLVVALAVLLGLIPGQAFADPGDPDEGGSPSLADSLESVATEYYDIQAKLATSQQRQEEIKKNLATAELALARLEVTVGNVAAARYKSGQMGGAMTGLLLGQGDTTEMLQGAAVAEYLAWRDDEQIREYRIARDEADKQRQLLEAEVTNEQNQRNALEQQKRDAEKALAAVGGLVTTAYDGPTTHPAQPAPRNADGTFPKETATIRDPTGTGGRITPRMFHALTEVRLAGFGNYVRCWRTQSWGEHPKGRACDFSSEPSGFGGTATGAAKEYGDKLAAWLIQNSSALGVLYVIWYKRIWMPGSGWRTYSLCAGDPSSCHTNHVHLSVI
jgi:peptidoglycan DL-endopeptidase CwlO